MITIEKKGASTTMKRTLWTRLTAFVLVALLAVSLMVPAMAEKTITVYAADYPLTKDGSYQTMEEVAVYLTVFGKLPGNYIRKRAAEDLGWNNRDGNLDEVAPGCSIGGNRFGKACEQVKAVTFSVIVGRTFTSVKSEQAQYLTVGGTRYAQTVFRLKFTHRRCRE